MDEKKGKGFFEILANTPPKVFWGLLAEPALLPVYLNARKGRNFSQVVTAFFPNKPHEFAERERISFLGNNHFFEELNKKFVLKRARRAAFQGWAELLYVLTRMSSPDVFVETGVFDGLSTAIVLQALEDNGKGILISVDLPASEKIQESTHRMRESTLPKDTKPGWAVPDYLRMRHKLFLGDSKEVLPVIFKEYPKIDIFLHDSLHTFDHQWFEYETAWPHLKPGGFLLSDDVLWTSAFHKFAKKKGEEYSVFSGFGVIRKHSSKPPRIFNV